MRHGGRLGGKGALEKPFKLVVLQRWLVAAVDTGEGRGSLIISETRQSET